MASTGTRLVRRAAATSFALLMLLSACSSAADDRADDPADDPAGDPAGALADAFEAIAEVEDIALVAEVTADPRTTDVTVPPVVSLLAGSEVEVRSSRGGATHLRFTFADDQDAQAAAERGRLQLATVGLSPAGDALVRGGWLRVGVDLDGEGTTGAPVARELGEGGVRLLDGAEVTSVGDEARGHRVRVLVDAPAAERFVADVVVALAAGERPTDRAAGTPETRTPDAATAQVPIEAWIDAGVLTALQLDLAALVGGDAGTGTVDLTIGDHDARDDATDEAPPVPLDALFDALAVGAAQPGDTSTGDGPGTDPTNPSESTPGGGEATEAGPDEDGDTSPAAPRTPRPTTPPELREGGVLEEAFGDGDVFVEGDGFDCLTDDDLAVFEAQLGPEAREELEELVAAGYVERC